jgi:hypothetical protein
VRPRGINLYRPSLALDEGKDTVSSSTFHSSSKGSASFEPPQLLPRPSSAAVRSHTRPQQHIPRADPVADQPPPSRAVSYNLVEAASPPPPLAPSSMAEPEAKVLAESLATVRVQLTQMRRCLVRPALPHDEGTSS